MSDQIKQDKFVSLTYTITDDSGDILERTDMPITYIHGRDDQVIRKIEQELTGRQQDDVISVTLSPAEGFGEHQAELTFSDDIENVPEQFRHIGAEVEFKNDHGETKIFRVTGIEDNRLTVDGNHPFAGKEITYNITVKEVRDATEEELAHGISSTPQLH